MALVLAAGCGRVNFDPLGDGAIADGLPITLVFRDGLDGYTGTVDTYLDLGAPDADRHLVETFLWHDDTPTTSSQQHGLLRFDAIFGPGAIPAGATIRSAELALVIFDACGGSAGSVSETTREWASTVTWNTFGPTPGVQPDDLRTTVAAAPMLDGRNVVDVTASLAAWAADPTRNNGWIFSPFAMNGDACGVRSSEVIDELSRPELTVTFVAP